MSGVPGSGLARGLAVTLKTMLHPSVTEQYPDVKPQLPPRSRGVIGLLEENCTVCMLCARECPDWCIYINSHKETVPATEPGARARTRNVLDRFGIDFALCMYCGICIEVCPFDALFWSPEFEYAAYDVTEMTHERDRLREWMWTVPPPPALDPSGEPAKEIAAAQKSLAGPAAGAARTPRPERPPRAERQERPARAEGQERPARGVRPERGVRPGRLPAPPPSGLGAAARADREHDEGAPAPALPQPGDMPAAEVPTDVAAAAQADSGASPAPPLPAPAAGPEPDR